MRVLIALVAVVALAPACPSGEPGESTPSPDDPTPEPTPEPPAEGTALCVQPGAPWLLHVVADDPVGAAAERLADWLPEPSPICRGLEHPALSEELGLELALRGSPGDILSWDGARLLGRATYELVVDVTWSEATHPGRIPGPEDFPHLSWVGGASHVDGYRFWDVGEVGSPGMSRMARAGNTWTLEEELVAERDASGAVAATFLWQGDGFGDPPGSRGNGFFAPSTTRGEFIDLLASHPRLSLVTMLGPSTDWFVGTPPEGVLLAGSQGWSAEVEHVLYPLDGGVTDLNERNPWRLLPCDEDPSLCSPATLPPDPIAWMGADSYLGDAPVGSFRFVPFITAEPVTATPAQADVIEVLLSQ